jgi:hypothetical protein
MTPEQLRAITLLSRCTFLPGSYDKRFVRSMRQMSEAPEPIPLTEKQDALLWVMVHRYRRQHGQCTCLDCLKAQNPNYDPHQGVLFEEGIVR